MRIKVKLRPMVDYFHLENEPVRNVFNGILSEELMKNIEEKYPTLGALQEADKRDLVSITNSKLYEAMKEAASKYIEELIINSSYVSNAEYIPMAMRLAYGKLAADLELYFYPILKLQEAIQKLPELEQRFLEMFYGLGGERESNETIIANEIGIKVSIDEYKKDVIKHLQGKID